MEIRKKTDLQNIIAKPKVIEEVIEKLLGVDAQRRNGIGHSSTPRKGHKLRGVGWTRPSKKQTKKRRVMAYRSRMINRHNGRRKTKRKR